MPAHLYCAPLAWAPRLAQELRPHGSPEELGPGCYRMEGEAVDACWAEQIAFDCQELPVASIGQAAEHLRAQGPWWHHAVLASARRGALIGEKLLKRRGGPLSFPVPAHRLKPLGCYSLLADDRLLWSPRCARPFGDGDPGFAENKTDPPSRAYLKFWEALTLLGDAPGPGDLALELGASPGAWTWTIANLGAQVHAIDKAPLDPRVSAMPGVTARQGSAFACLPSDAPYTWIFSDVICYPQRLMDFLDRWLAQGGPAKGVLTLKFQGDDPAAEQAAIARARRYPGARVLHMHNNKHEVSLLLHPHLAGPWPRPWPWVAST